MKLIRAASVVAASAVMITAALAINAWASFASTAVPSAHTSAFPRAEALFRIRATIEDRTECATRLPGSSGVILFTTCKAAADQLWVRHDAGPDEYGIVSGTDDRCISARGHAEDATACPSMGMLAGSWPWRQLGDGKVCDTHVARPRCWTIVADGDAAALGTSQNQPKAAVFDLTVADQPA